MKHLTTKLLSVFLFVMLLQSCSDQLEHTPVKPDAVSDDIKVVNGRLSFPSTTVYFETIDKISKMNDEDRLQWQSRHEFPSLLKHETSSIDNSAYLKQLSSAYQSVLNAKGEVAIEGTLVWYAADGVKHLVPGMDEARLEKIQKGAIKNTFTEKYSILVASLNDRADSQGRFTWNNPGNRSTESRWQHEFLYHNSSGSRRKYVHELYLTIDGNYQSLYLVAKLEWYGNSSHKWKDAGEMRWINVNVVCNVRLLGGSRGYNGSTYVPISQSKNTNGHWDIPIASDWLTYSSYTYWDIDIQGNIYHEIIDDPYSGWNNTGYPLW